MTTTNGLYGVSSGYYPSYSPSAYGQQSASTPYLSFKGQLDSDTFQKKEGMGTGTKLLIAGLVIGGGILAHKAGWFGKLKNLFTRGAKEGAEQVGGKISSGVKLTNVSQKSLQEAADAAQKTLNSSVDDFAKISGKTGDDLSNVSNTINTYFTNKNVVNAFNNSGDMQTLAKGLAKTVGKDGDATTIKAAEKLIKAKYQAIYSDALNNLANAKTAGEVQTIISNLPDSMQKHIQAGQGKLIKHILSKSEISQAEVETLGKMGLNVTTKKGKITSVNGNNLNALKQQNFAQLDSVKTLNSYREKQLTSILDNYSKEAFEARPDYYNKLIQQKLGKEVTFEATEKGLKVNGLDSLGDEVKATKMYKNLKRINQNTENALRKSEQTFKTA